MFRTVGRFLNRLDKRTVTRRVHRDQRFSLKDSNAQYGLLLCPAIAFGLGCWQVQRRSWKLKLIEDLETRTAAPPIELPKDLREVENLEYRAVRVRGVFDHDEEVYIGPRMEKDEGNVGFHVITPLKLEDRDCSILVNRGWVPRNKTNPATRREGQVAGVVEVEGVVRLTEPKPLGAREVRSGEIFSMRDVEMIAQILGTAPVFIDAAKDTSVPGGPIGGQTRVELRNEHLSYILTWFALSAALTFMWLKRYRKVYRR